MVNFEKLTEVLRRTGDEKVVVVDGDETYVLMTLDAYTGEYDEFDFDDDDDGDIYFSSEPYAEEVLPELEEIEAYDDAVPEELASVIDQDVYEPMPPIPEPPATEPTIPVFHEEPPVIPAGIQSENVRYEEF